MKKLLLATALTLGATGVLAEEIRVLNWQGYGTDAEWAVAAFTEATGHTVVHEYFTSEQEMLTKLRTNPGAYDVVLINAAFTAQAQAEGLIAPIDTSKIPNFKDVAPDLAANPDLNPAGRCMAALDLGADLDRRQQRGFPGGTDIACGAVGPCLQGPRLDPRRRA